MLLLINDISMDFDTYKREFTSKALASGYSSDNIIRCLKYASCLFANNVPVIYNTSHLSALVGYKKNYLKRAVAYPEYFYKEYSIKKKNGNVRIISEPLPSLMEIQRWLLKNVLLNINISKYAKAYIPNASIKGNVAFHRKQKLVYSIDIKDFFHSIKFSSVESIFLQLGYSQLISNLLAKLCCLNETLPQGAPTSPYLSNIYMKDFDRSIANYCEIKEIRYTRYADDLTFSGDFDYKALYNIVCNELQKSGLVINNDKTRLMKKSQRQVVTSIVVNEKVQVDRERRLKIRQSIYYIKKYGLQNHLKRINNTKQNYVKHLLGQVNFVLFINPKDEEFKSYKDFLLSI